MNPTKEFVSFNQRWLENFDISVRALGYLETFLGRFHSINFLISETITNVYLHLTNQKVNSTNS